MMWELVGAVVGAGLASGREVASFFAAYGNMGYLGIATAGLTMGILGMIRHPIRWRYPWMQQAWRLLLVCMLIVTASAMLAGAGEIAELVLPVRGACWIGVALTFALALLLARKSVTSLALVSKALLIVLGVMIIAALFSAQQSAACTFPGGNTASCLLRGFMYGGFNAALQVPILEGRLSAVRIGRDVWGASLVCCALITLGTILILRQPMLLSEPMPFLKAVAPFGRTGYYMYAACLYLAILSTMIACFKGIKGTAGLAAVVAFSQLGFTGVVDWLYPLLGASCFAVLLCAKFLKSTASPFHSARDVL